MTDFVTSDLHFSHKNVIKFCPKTRGQWSNADEMDAGMIAIWNSIVGVDDTTYIIGDFAFADAAKAVAILNQLNGTKILVEGNHDRTLLKDGNFRKCFKMIRDYLEIYHNDTRVVMSHYPMAAWNQSFRGSVMLHGHLHDQLSGLEEYRIRNVGFDFTGNVVSKLDDIVADALTGKKREF